MMTHVKALLRPRSGASIVIMRSASLSFLVACCLALQVFGAPEPFPVPTPQASGPSRSAPGAVKDSEGEMLEQHGVALVRTAKWRILEEIDIQHAPPAGGLIIGTTNSGKIVAYDAVTGQKKWEKASGGTEVSMLEVEGDMVFIRATGAPHAITALALADGAEKWVLDLPNVRMQMDVNGPRVNVGVNLSPPYRPARGPTLRPATREVPPGPPELRTFAQDTGKLLWTYPLPEGTTEYGGYALESAGDLLYLFTYRRVEGAGVTALNAADGKVRWSYPIPMGTESAEMMLADGFVVMDLAKDAEPPEKGHQELVLLNAVDGTVARQIDVDESFTDNRALPHGLMLMARAPLLKSFPTFDFVTTRTLTVDDGKAKFTLWDLKSGAQKWNTAVFLDEKKYDTTSMNIRQELYLDADSMLVSLDGETGQKYIWSLTLLDLATGKKLWSNTVENAHISYLNHVLFNKQLIIISSEEGVLAISRTDGRRLWYIDSPGTVWIAADGTLYLQIREPSPGLPAGLFAIPLEGNLAANPASAPRP